MAIKGTAKIQLFDAKTGKLKQEVVKENMVTNAVPNILNPAMQMRMGFSLDSYNITDYTSHFLKRCSPIGKVLFGGILVFDKPLQENADNIIPSIEDRNSIIGYAGQYESNIGNEFKGSYNANESVELENGFTHVWDFATNQANGEINALALTSAMGGDCGWHSKVPVRGNFIIPISTNKDFTASDKTASTLTLFNAGKSIFYGTKFKEAKDFNRQSIVVTNGKYAMLLGTDYIDDKNVAIKYVAKNLSNDINLNQVIDNSLFDTYNVGVADEGIWYSDTIGVEFNSSHVRVQVKNNTARYIFTSSDILVGATATQTVTFVDFTLSESGSVSVSSPRSITFNNADILTVINGAILTGDVNTSNQYSYLLPGYAWYDDDYAYIQTEGYNDYGTAEFFIRVSMSNTTDIELLNKPDNGTQEFYIGYFQGEYILSDNTNIWRTSDFVKYYKLDTCLTPANYPYALQEYQFIPMKLPYIGLQNRTFMKPTASDACNVVPCLIAPYLATINNLEKPLVKTSSLTMKITYTIQNT